MKYSKQLTDIFGLFSGIALLAVTIIIAISMLFITPAYADHGHGHGHGGEEHGEHGWRGGYGGGYGYGYGGYGYAQPVYAPPPVYYPPQASPGINVMFPLNFRIR